LSLPDLNKLKHEFLDKRVNSHPGAMLDAAAHMLFELGDSNRLMHVATRFVAKELGACRADIGLGSRFDKTYEASAEWLDIDNEVPSMEGVVLPNQSLVLQSVWNANAPVAYVDCYNDPNLASMKEGFVATRLRSLVARKLEHAGNPFGIICVDQTTHARVWEETNAHEFLDEFSSEFLSPILQMSVQLNSKKKPSPKELDAIRLEPLSINYEVLVRKWAR